MASFRQPLAMQEVEEAGQEVGVNADGMEDVWQGVRVRLASYNLLADSVLFKHRSLYGSAPLSSLKWAHRRAKVVDQLCELSADVYALQEFECKRSGLAEALSQRGYGVVGQQRSSSGLNMDGCGFAFKTTAVELVRWQVIGLNAMEGSPQRFEDVASRIGPSMASLLNRNNIGLVALFSTRQESGEAGSLFCAINTHLLFNPRRGEVKLAQVLLLLDDVKCFLAMSLGEDMAARTPVVFLGDCNLLPHSRLYHLLAGGSLALAGDDWPATLSGQEEEKGRGSSNTVAHARSAEEAPREYRGRGVTVKTDGTDLHVSHDMVWESVYQHNTDAAGCRKCDGTTIVSRKVSTVDYIFFTPNNVRLAAVLPLPTLDNAMLLPTWEHPSDHLMLAADFYLRCCE